ncbi:hypothetical protein [Streptomyces sp. AS02]|uniref:hypothetical protein n=1 Tax=Streptomyces sp. AS02 TaxID=2938946 RepID=UPI002021A2BF|nr:hypothetical protein [Streptomyces sp. AS02]MCL8016880.1 hypothetical protein [Streptomyces sp. AS02]
MTDTLPEGHPLAWEDLVPYEQQQGGYWLYPTGCDVYGNGKIWVRVPRPERPGELAGFANQMHALAQEMKTRGLDTRNRAMADLGAELEGLAVRAKDAAAG